jgi:hypothetical protein
MDAQPPRLWRIALVGAHETGKSTLADALATALPAYQVVEEPYRALEAEGHVFADPPELADFEEQFARSCTDFAVHRSGVIFDRSPVDLMAYLLALSGAGGDGSRWFDDMRAAAASLDLLVFVPIERPDRIAATSALRLRRAVDRQLRAGLIDDEWGLAVPTLEVAGPLSSRIAQIRARVG